MSGAARILVVDDDRDIVAAIRVVLEGNGYQVAAAHDAASGLAAIEADRPDLVLLDVMMPQGTEGFHLVWKLRQKSEPYFQRLPIIMLTAIHSQTKLRFYPDTSDGTYSPGEYLPVQGFLDKPVSPDRLLARVAGALALARAP
jgi:CheY-like chemotaxis protein